MDYSQFRRSTNVEDARAEGVEALWRQIAPNAPTWDEIKHPFTPSRGVQSKKQNRQLPPVIPGSMEDQAGAGVLPEVQVQGKGDREDRGHKGDRLDRVPQQFLAETDNSLPTSRQSPAKAGSGMRPEVVDAITRAAKDAGEDPAFALAVAERESNGDPNAHSSKTIYGAFQMRGDLRDQYGAGDSADPYDQARGWMRFMGATRQSMTNRLGREPTPPELYLAHHFGEDRAVSMLNGRIPGSMATGDVFSPYEMSINPHFGRAGTVGNLTSGIEDDITNRMGRYGGVLPKSTQPATDFASFGQPPEAPTQDFAAFGAAPKGPPDGADAKLPTQSGSASPENSATNSRPGQEVDLSQFDIPSMWTGYAGAAGAP